MRYKRLGVLLYGQIEAAEQALETGILNHESQWIDKLRFCAKFISL